LPRPLTRQHAKPRSPEILVHRGRRLQAQPLHSGEGCTIREAVLIAASVTNRDHAESISFACTRSMATTASLRSAVPTLHAAANGPAPRRTFRPPSPTSCDRQDNLRRTRHPSLRLRILCIPSILRKNVHPFRALSGRAAIHNLHTRKKIISPIFPGCVTHITKTMVAPRPQRPRAAGECGRPATKEPPTLLPPPLLRAALAPRGEGEEGESKGSRPSVAYRPLAPAGQARWRPSLGL